jgi:hypothetical protein
LKRSVTVTEFCDDPQELGEAKRVVNAVLEAIDARAPLGLAISITNYEGLFDPAIWRRLDDVKPVASISVLSH